MPTNIFHTLRVGTIYVRGIQHEQEKKPLVNDALLYNIQVLGISETHIQTLTGAVPGNEGLEEYRATSETKQRDYILYYTGSEKHSHHGVGLLVQKELNPTFKTISNRICSAKIELAKYNVHIISAYAPTLNVSERQTTQRDDFYDQLDAAVNKIPLRDVLYVVGDFNAKTGSSWLQYKENMGRFGKGYTNSNGERLLEFAATNKLILTNTCFSHKLCHRTTWTAPRRKEQAPIQKSDGKPRRNPYRNQIDYILTRATHWSFIQDSRSYGGVTTQTDHKLVLANIKLDWWHLRTANTASKNTNIQHLAFPEKRTQYQETLREELRKSDNGHEDPDQSWKNLTNLMLTSAETTLGSKDKKKKYDDPEIEELSKKQKELHQKIDNSKNYTEERQLRTARNKIMKQIKNRVTQLNDTVIADQLQELENAKDDSNKYHLAMRNIHSHKQKKTLMVQDEEGLFAGSVQQQLRIITNHFKHAFSNKNEPISKPVIQPTEMRIPFTADEIRKATKSMKNNRSAGKDNINAELVKYAPQELHQNIAELLNQTAKTGKHPQVIKQGILTPLPKPNKKPGPPAHLRPIILLSVLRKALTICLIGRTWDRLSTRIHRSQAAYQSGRGGTEQVLAVKILLEKAISSSDYQIYLLLLDMSKAFDTVNRNLLLKDLSEVLEADELHLMSILIEDVTIQVKVGKELGEEFITEEGVCQGDVLSAIFFIFYLSISLTPKTHQLSLQEHNYAWQESQPSPIPKTIPPHIDHTYAEPEHQDHADGMQNSTPQTPAFEIDPKYADDITWATTSKERIYQVKQTIPPRLRARQLCINESKTEEFSIKRGGNEEWKKCKLLGSLLETNEDIARRKAQTNNVIKSDKLNAIFTSTRISESIKIRNFNTYVDATFLFNSETWAITDAQAKKLDAFQRRKLRQVIGIKWPHTISNEALYNRTKIERWSQKIKRRRLNLLGHVMRLPSDTPARQSIKEGLTKCKRPKGRPPTNWLGVIKNDLKEHMNLTLNNKDTPENQINTLCNITRNRSEWRRRVRHAVIH